MHVRPDSEASTVPSESMVTPLRLLRRTIALAVLCSVGLWAQNETPPIAHNQNNPVVQNQDQGVAQDQKQDPNNDQNSVGQDQENGKVEPAADRVVTPGTVATKPPERAFKTLIKNTIHDQKVMWTSPFYARGTDAALWLGFAGVTGVLIAYDSELSKQLPNTNDQMRFSRWISQTGATYTLYPIAAGFYLGGLLGNNPKAKEVGALGGEALTDALIISSVIKGVTGRERPETDLRGRFFQYGNYSFVSGHAIMSWALASLVAHEYHQTKIIPITAYSLATIVSAARFSARKHFASDIVAGGAMGYFIGRYVYHAHADQSIHKNPLSRLMPSVVPYMNPDTASTGVGLAWNVGSR